MKKGWLQIGGLVLLIAVIAFISCFGFGESQAGSYHGVSSDWILQVE